MRLLTGYGPRRSKPPLYESLPQRGYGRQPMKTAAVLWRWVLLAFLGTAVVSCGPGEYRGSGSGAATGAATPAPSAAQPRMERTVPYDPDETRVALLVPLTGAQSRLGQAMLHAAELAIEDAGNDRLLLLPKDTGGTPEGAAAAANQALDEGAQLILGPLLASSVTAVRPIALNSGVNIISFSSDQSVAGDGAFVMGFLPRDQVRQVVAYAVSDGRSRFAVLAPDTAYGRIVAEETERAVSENNAFVTKVTFYDPNSGDVSATVRAFANYDSRTKGEKELGEGLDFDAVMLPEGGLRLLQVAPLLPFYDVDPGKVLYLGTGLWDSPVVHREQNLVGGLFAAPPPEARRGFVARYKALFGREPPRLATLAYDATALAALLSQTPDGQDFSQEAITNAEGFTGADGLMRFTPSGTVERGLAVLRVEKGGFSVVNPAMSSFQAALN